MGSNLSEIRNEILKIKSYLGHRSHISEEDVLKVVSRSRTHNVFDLANAIGKKDIPTALIYLAKLLENGENEVAVLSLLLRHFRILGLIHKAQSEGLTNQRLSSAVGIPQFFLGQYQQQSNLWDRSQIKNTIICLHETDRALKSSLPPPIYGWKTSSSSPASSKQIKNPCVTQRPFKKYLYWGEIVSL